MLTAGVSTKGEARFTVGLNRTVFGLMAAIAISLFVLEGEASMAPARSSGTDLKLEEVGREATGLVISGLSATLISISPDDWLIDIYFFQCDEAVQNIDDPELQAASPFSLKECSVTLTFQ